MTNLEKLAKEYSDVWRCPIETTDLIDAYKAGFNKALELAADARQHQCEWEEMSCMCDEFSEEIRELGEEKTND